MDNSNPGVPSNDPIKELFGPPPPRRPIPSKSFDALVKIFSLFSDQNPFSECASNAKLPEFPRQCRDNLIDSRRLASGCVLCVDCANHTLHLSDVEHVVVPRVEKEASNTLAGSDTVEAHILSVHDHEANNERVPGEGCKDIGFSGSKLINELGRTNKSKTMEKLPSAEEGTSTGMAEVDKVHEELSDVFINNSVIAESSNSAKVTVDGNMKGYGAEEKKQKHVEVSTSTSGGDEAKSHTHLSVVREISDCREVGIQHVGMCPGEAQMPQGKQRKAPQGLSESENPTFAAPKSNNTGGTISNSIMMRNKSSAVTKGKIKKVKKTSAKDVNSGKSKILSIDSGTSYNMSSGGVDPVVCEKMVKQSVYGNTGKSTARKVGNNWPKSCAKIHYSRQELLNIWKMTSVPEDILKIVREIDAEVHSKYQDSAAGKKTDAGSAKKKNPGPPTENKMAEEEGEKCKFSHDVIPLTKSQPCCHFARQACMKGDDCPFDHQLSNYPCNSYVSTNFCSRGDSCSFSHKIPTKKVAETAAGVSHFGSTIRDQLDKSDSKQQLDANASFSSGVATPKNLKENIATQASLPGKAPKGLSFLSSGKSSLKDSGKLKEIDLSQKSGSATGTSSRPNIATTAVNVVKDLIDTPASDTPQGKGFISFVRHSAGSSGDKKQANPSQHRDNSRFYSFGKSENVNSSHKSDDPSATSDQLNKEMSSKVLSVCGMPEANPVPMSPKQISVPSSGGFPNCAGKSQATLPNNGHLGSQMRESESAKGSEKAVQPKLWGSPASSGQSPIMIGVKNTPGTAQRALLSTLSFAAKYGSGIKMTSASSAKEVTKNERASSGSGCTQDEPSKASAILDFLYSGSNKKKQ
uniref:C3H1-type domain-containing protein n=1 Tax=Chenopodium quinoa TaxID=63459 RepID=A0A803MRP2_CHEQI